MHVGRDVGACCIAGASEVAAAAGGAFASLPEHERTAVAISAPFRKWSRKPYVQDVDPTLVESIMSDMIRHDTGACVLAGRRASSIRRALIA